MSILLHGCVCGVNQCCCALVCEFKVILSCCFIVHVSATAISQVYMCTYSLWCILKCSQDGCPVRHPIAELQGVPVMLCGVDSSDKQRDLVAPVDRQLDTISPFPTVLRERPTHDLCVVPCLLNY